MQVEVDREGLPPIRLVTARSETGREFVTGSPAT